jgi:hypothetical protein
MVFSNDQLGCLANKIRLLAYKRDVRDDKYRDLDNELVWPVRIGFVGANHSMIVGCVHSGSGELGSKNHDRDERLPGTRVHCKDGILVKCACC